YGQRVEKAKIFLQTAEGPQLLTEIVTIGYQKIISFEAVGVSAVKIVFTQVRQTPIIQTMAARYVPQEE
ncbi:alpha-L-fucosidase, partial [Listeria monocytogenes]|nr:alpha-L-fucosidase [Listeria monocytogenes]